jgi:hypothetical protein
MIKLKSGITVNIERHTFVGEIPEEYAGSVPQEFIDNDDKSPAASGKRSRSNSGGDLVSSSEPDSTGRTDI